MSEQLRRRTIVQAEHRLDHVYKSLLNNCAIN